MIIDNFDISKKVLIVAEIGNNHEGSLNLAKELIELAHKCGANAVKFQTIEPNLLVKSNELGRIKMLEKFYFSPEEYKELKNYCDKVGIIFLSTPFSIECIEWLNNLVPAFKISSGDLTYHSLIKEVAKQGKPILLSTGMSNLKEIENAISIINSFSPIKDSKERSCLMHCVSAYPTKEIDANLKCINTLKKFSNLVGYSDHTLGIEASIVAVALGARVIEKHFTISKDFSDFRDHALSADPNELRDLIYSIRKAEDLLGSAKKTLFECEQNTHYAARRSFVAAKELKKGLILKSDDIIALRPLMSIPAERINDTIGRTLNKNFRKGDSLREEDLN